MRGMRSWGVSACMLGVLLAAGCAWQRVPEAPAYSTTAPLPLRVGVLISENPASAVNAPRVIERLRERRVVDALIFPYRRDEDVDAFLVIKITGGWDYRRRANCARAFLVGFSLGALSPFLGSSMTGRHDLVATLSVGGQTVGPYLIRRETTARWGLAADVEDVSRKALDTQMDLLAADLARRIRDDWPRISEQIGR